MELGHRAIAASCAIGQGSVCDYLKRAEKAGLTWQQAKEMSDAEVESRLFRHVGRQRAERAGADRLGVGPSRAAPDGRDVAAVVAGVPGGRRRERRRRARAYQYSQFCDLYAELPRRLEPSMRQVHRAGEKLFIDYSGKKPRIVDRETGEVIEVELFVAVLGASNYTYAEATRTQRLADFVASNVGPSNTSGAFPRSSCPISSVAPSAGPTATTRTSTRPTSRWRSTTGSPSSRRGPEAEGQGEGRGGRADRAALDPGVPA